MHRTFAKLIAPTSTGGLLLIPVLGLLFSFGIPASALVDPTIIEIKMGDYRFTPADVRLAADRPTVSGLINMDGMTPHNFSLNAGGHAADIDVDVSAGDSV